MRWHVCSHRSFRASASGVELRISVAGTFSADTKRAELAASAQKLVLRYLMLLLLIEGAWSLPKVVNATVERCDSIADVR